MPTQKAVSPAEVRSAKEDLSRENTADSPVVQELRREDLLRTEDGLYR